MEDLVGLAERYPYAPNVLLLLVLKAKREEHPQLPHYLSRFAAATFDRPHLYNLLHRLDRQAEEPGETLELIALEELELTPLSANPVEELPSRLNEATLAAPLRQPIEQHDAPVALPPVVRPNTSASTSYPAKTTRGPQWVATAAAFSELLAQVHARFGPSIPQIKSPTAAGPQDPTRFLPIINRYGDARPLRERLERLRRPAGTGPAGELSRSSAYEPVVSETLADLLVRQEQYHHAIRMYQRLELLYPEKKAIFADRIQELKEKI